MTLGLLADASRLAPLLADIPASAPEWLWSFMVSHYFVTIAIEAPILFALLSPRHSWQTRLIAGFWLTACTYPIVVVVLWLLLIPTLGYGIYLAIAETFAPVAECFLFYFAFARNADLAAERDAKLLSLQEADLAQAAGPPSPYDTWRDMAAIVVANLASFLLGVLFQQLFPIAPDPTGP